MRQPSDLAKWKISYASSIAEAEYRIMAHGVCEFLWFKTLLQDLGMVDDGPMKLYCDNKLQLT